MKTQTQYTLTVRDMWRLQLNDNGSDRYNGVHVLCGHDEKDRRSVGTPLSVNPHSAALWAGHVTRCVEALFINLRGCRACAAELIHSWLRSKSDEFKEFALKSVECSFNNSERRQLRRDIKDRRRHLCAYMEITSCFEDMQSQINSEKYKISSGPCAVYVF